MATLFLLLILSFGVGAIVFVTNLFTAYDNRGWHFLGLVGCVIILYYIMTNSTFNAVMDENWKEKQRQNYERAKPRLLYKQDDGCEVYRFEADGLNHYYTKCPNATTTTDTTILEKHGKTTTEKIDQITTQ